MFRMVQQFFLEQLSKKRVRIISCYLLDLRNWPQKAVCDDVVECCSSDIKAFVISRQFVSV